MSCQCHPEGDVSPPPPDHSLTSLLSLPLCPRLPLAIVRFLWPLFSACLRFLSPSPSLSIRLSSCLSIIVGGGVLGRCSVTANCRLKGAKAGGGETCGRQESLVAQGGAQGQKLNSGLLKMFGFVFGWTREDLPIGFFFFFSWTLGCTSPPRNGVKHNS